MDKEKRVEYARQWKESSQHFYVNNDYKWSVELLRSFKTVLEIGSGTGQSTLELLSQGHKVIAVEKNESCIASSKQLLVEHGYTYSDDALRIEDADVNYIHGDISDESIAQQISELSFDIAVCWNVGTHWSKEVMEEYISKLLIYGLTVEQIRSNPESCYGEYIQWRTCDIAIRNKVPAHIIDRNAFELNKKNDTYFVQFKKEFGFSNIEYVNRKTVAKSLGGRVLSVNGIPCNSDLMDIHLISVLLTI